VSNRLALRDQVFGGAVSIAANIVDGRGGIHRRDCRRLMAIARGSPPELAMAIATRPGCGTLAGT
jgi:four helix bundle protein